MVVLVLLLIELSKSLVEILIDGWVDSQLVAILDLALVVRLGWSIAHSIRIEILLLVRDPSLYRLVGRCFLLGGGLISRRTTCICIAAPCGCTPAPGPARIRIRSGTGITTLARTPADTAATLDPGGSGHQLNPELAEVRLEVEQSIFGQYYRCAASPPVGKSHTYRCWMYVAEA
jgi:hypothetical protein